MPVLMDPFGANSGMNVCGGITMIVSTVVLTTLGLPIEGIA
ncbi:MAG: hypothetical protein PHP61_06345 [Candidatus Izemoplasmatales bacterium]|nr:hypothetical protein [Candidatus Izemoplasmatales bacterium]